MKTNWFAAFHPKSLRVFVYLAVSIVVIFVPRSTEAAIVRHTLTPTDSVFSVQSQQTCSTYLLQPNPHWCNPALFSFSKKSAIKADIAINADQDAYDTTNRLINQPITKEFLELLFKTKDFQSFSALIRLEALSPLLSFSFTPAYLVGAYRLSNPNLPELSVAAARESQIRVTSGTLVQDWKDWKLHAGASLYFYDRKTYYVNANALELVVKDINTLVEAKQQKGVNSDVGIFLENMENSLPNFSIVGENIISPQLQSLHTNRNLDLEPLFRRRVRVGVGQTMTHDTGSYYLGLQTPFLDFFREFDRYETSVGLTYGIGRLRGFTSLSPLMYSFGFSFMSDYYDVGIQYTSNKQDNSLELRRSKNVYLFASFTF